MILPDETERLITDWFRRVRESQRIHYECGTFFSRLNYWFGIPAVALSTSVGTAVFASVKNAIGGQIGIALGLLSITAAVLGSLQTFLGFSQRADKHRLTGSEYGAIRRSLEYLKTFPPSAPEELKAAVAAIKEQMDATAKAAPEVPARIKRRVDAQLKSREHQRVFHLMPTRK